jgi:hypothetical protein
LNHIWHIARHIYILARLCETIPYMCSYVVDTITINNNNDNNYPDVMSTETTRNTDDIIQNAHVFGISNHTALECATVRLINAINIQKSEKI